MHPGTLRASSAAGGNVAPYDPREGIPDGGFKGVFEDDDVGVLVFVGGGEDVEGRQAVSRDESIQGGTRGSIVLRREGISVRQW